MKSFWMSTKRRAVFISGCGLRYLIILFRPDLLKGCQVFCYFFNELGVFIAKDAAPGLSYDFDAFVHVLHPEAGNFCRGHGGAVKYVLKAIAARFVREDRADAGQGFCTHAIIDGIVAGDGDIDVLDRLFRRIVEGETHRLRLLTYSSLPQDQSGMAIPWALYCEKILVKRG